MLNDGTYDFRYIKIVLNEKIERFELGYELIKIDRQLNRLNETLAALYTL